MNAWKGQYSQEEWQRIDSAYKTGSHWNNVVVPTTRKRLKDRCKVCGRWYMWHGGYITTHHYVYYDEKGLVYGRELPEMLTLLCNFHHRKGKYTLTEIRRDKTLFWLHRIASWPLRAIAEVFGI